MGFTAKSPMFSFVDTPQGRVLETSFADLGKNFRLDYEKGSLGYRLKPERVMHEPLAKVIDKHAFVFDATGGFLKDALMMAFLGCRVWVCEAHPLIASLVQDALARAALNLAWAKIILDENRFKFFALDARIILQQFLADDRALRPDIVYLDPMFPPKRKSSIAKREIQWLQRIHSVSSLMYPDYQQSSAEVLLELGLRVAKKRVVVKRPMHAPTLVQSPLPSFSRAFQSARFDVYLVLAEK